MLALDTLGAVFALPIMLGVGTVAHEFAHGVVLRALGIPYDIEWFPDRDASSFLNVSLFATWATITPRVIPREIPVWGLRLSALAPLLLVTPLLFVFVGFLPDPLEANSTLYAVITVVWLGCALPSPQDFSLFWYAEQVIDDYGGELPADR